MNKIQINGKIDLNEIKDMTSKDVELFLRNKINDELRKKIDEQLDKFSFIDLKHNEENNTFDFNADLVICSANEIETSINEVVKELIEIELEPSEIEDILEPLSNKMKGW